MVRVFEVVLLIVLKVARPNIVPPELELRRATSPRVVFPSLVAQDVSARQEGGLLVRLVVVKVPIAFLDASLARAVSEVAGAVVPVPIAM
jgi:hypothetical protein